MLERAALHQTRFRTPGVSPDARGVVLGQQGLVLFPSIDRLVAFFRAYGDESAIDDLVPTLNIRRLITPLKTREIMLSIAAETSYRMDRIAGIAKLAGGLVFTGTSRHFVKYRDSTSPLGYDVLELTSDEADLILYHDTFRQSYDFEREISLLDLLFKLQPYRVPHRASDSDFRGGDEGQQLWASAEVGIGNAILTYLFRWQVESRAAMAEWPPESAFDDRGKRLFIFDLTNAPTRVVDLLNSLPGVIVHEPVARNVAVELGYRHPIALESCASLFDEDSLHLFQGDGEVLVVDPMPPFAPVRSLVRTNIDEEAKGPHEIGGIETALNLSLPLKLAVSQEPWRNVTATVIPIEEREWLARILYAVPPNTLATLRMAIGEHAIYLFDPGGIEGIPLGRFYTEITGRIFVPCGLTIVPAVAPAVLEDLIRERGSGYAFFSPDSEQPIVVADSAFGPASRRALREVAAAPVLARSLDIQEPELPLLRYDRARRFPLWGVPKAPSGDE